jgi:hypothetical protein
MRDAALATKKSVDATQKSAEVAEKTLISTQRPWIRIVDVELEGPPGPPRGIMFHHDGIQISIIYQLENIGAGPAKDVEFFIEALPIISDQDMKITEMLPEFCQIRKVAPYGFSAIGKIVGFLFPNEISKKNWLSVHHPIARFEKQSGRKLETIKSILMVAYATYKFPFDNTIHITGVPYLLTRKNGTPIFPPQADDIPLPGEVLNVPISKLSFSAIWASYAD